MKIDRLTFLVLAATLSVFSGSGMAADANDSPGMSAPGMHGQTMTGGDSMDEGVMAGGMMKGCPMMAGHFPPGNEKLEMQMHGEMLKAMGDIMLTYAGRMQSQPAK